MFYARLASGYRNGGPNTTAILFNLPLRFEPDKTNNYEIGAKGSLLNDRLSYDASVYYIDWKNIQLQLNTPQGATYVANASRAKSQGIELSAQARPITRLQLSGWVAWNEAVLTQSFPASLQRPFLR
jgi:outer membrane receptor protein involved in Fe transport